MPRADFQFVRFNERFSDDNPRVTRTFTVEGTPLGSGYLLIQAHDVESDKHSISINGQALPRFDIPEGSGGKWQLWMDLIPAGFLTSGENRIMIARVKRNDNFFIASIAVHWREDDSLSTRMPSASDT